MTPLHALVAITVAALGGCGATRVRGAEGGAPGEFVTFVDQDPGAAPRAERVVAGAGAAGCRITQAGATIWQMDCTDGSYAVNAAGTTFVGVCPAALGEPGCRDWFNSVSARATGATPGAAPGAGVVPPNLFGGGAPPQGGAAPPGTPPAGDGIKIED